MLLIASLLITIGLFSVVPVFAAGNVATCDEANLDAALAGGGLVTFSCSGTITVTSTKIISASTTIDGTGQSVTISGGNAVRIFQVNSGVTLNVTSLTVSDGYGLPLGSLPQAGAGAILNAGGTVNITTSTFTNNSAGDGRQGGAIVNDTGGTVNVVGSIFSNNSALGVAGSGGSSGAIANYNVLNISNSVFSNNSSNVGGVSQNTTATSTISVSGSTFTGNTSVDPGCCAGGGVFANGGTLIVTTSTFSGNSAATDGGGVIYNFASATISNSTFTGNSAVNQGGVILNNAVLTATNVTFAGNSAGAGGNLVNNATLTLINSIVASAGSGGNCSGSSITDGGNNLQFGDASCGAITVGDPVLGALASNGGPTQTMALGAGSVAIDAGSNAVCAAAPINNVDQRGSARPTDGNGDSSAVCDIGAYEAPAVPPTNQAPVCTGASPSVASLWPPNHNLVAVNILGVTDPDSNPVTVVISSIYQDEPVNGTGSGDTSPDAFGVGTSLALVRSERAGSGNGRVYHISFIASDGLGGNCAGQVLVSVPHSNNGTAVDGGALYDSTLP